MIGGIIRIFKGHHNLQVYATLRYPPLAWLIGVQYILQPNKNIICLSGLSVKSLHADDIDDPGVIRVAGTCVFRF
jgi:hypothetical protein